MNTTATPILLALLVAILAAMVASQDQTQVKDFALSTDTPVPCEDIMTTHRFQGDCCALNSTVGGGCILTVINGRCKISGQEWTLDYTSTFDSDGAVCPGSEFAPDGVIFATKAPVPAPTEVPSAGVGSTSIMMKTTAIVSILLLAASILAVAV
jgi:hypothetical protein